MISRSAICLGFVAFLLMSTFAHARSTPPSPELARKCRDLALQAHPTAAAGSSSGTAQAQRKFFRNCVHGDGDGDGQP